MRYLIGLIGLGLLLFGGVTGVTAAVAPTTLHVSVECGQTSVLDSNQVQNQILTFAGDGSFLQAAGHGSFLVTGPDPSTAIQTLSWAYRSDGYLATFYGGANGTYHLDLTAVDGETTQHYTTTFVIDCQPAPKPTPPIVCPPDLVQTEPGGPCVPQPAGSGKG